MTEPLDGARLLITGAGSGIGRALARMAADAGAVLTLADIDLEGVAKVANETGGTAVRLDVGDEVGWAEMAHDHGPWNHVALNAGLMSAPPHADPATADIFSLELEAYRRVLSVNVDGVVFGVRATVPAMRGHGGSVVATASAAGLVGLGHDPTYSLSKHAVVGLVRSVAARLEPANLRHPERAVRICAVAPGSVRTPMFPTMFDDFPAMDPSVVAAEIVDLMIGGDNGEVRARIETDLPAQRIDEPELAGWVS